MFKYILKRIGLMILTLFIILSIVFILIRSIPGVDGLTENPNVENEAEDVEVSPLEEYFVWLRNIFPKEIEVECTESLVEVATKGDTCYGKAAGEKASEIRLTYWGYSTKLQPGTPAFDVLKERIPISMFINIFVLVISMPLGIFLGTIAALRKNKPIDHAISVGVIFFISVPSFVLAFFMTYFIAFRLEWFEVRMSEHIVTILRDFVMKGKGLPKFTKVGIFTEGERTLLDNMSVYGEVPSVDNSVSANEVENMFVAYWALFKTIIMPIAALSFGPIAALTRYTRAELTEVLTSDFMLLAKSKGLTRTQATIRHAFRNSMLPLLGMIIGMFVGIMGGSLMIERIFSIPGMGAVSYDALTSRDYSVVIVSTAFYTTIGLLTTLFVDLMYGVVDPRVRLGGRA